MGWQVIDVDRPAPARTFATGERMMVQILTVNTGHVA